LVLKCKVNEFWGLNKISNEEIAMKQRMTILLKTVGLVCFISLFILLVGERPSQAAEPIKIGAVFTNTGWAGFLGAPQKEAVEVEVDRINSEGGVLGRPLKVYYEDDQSNPTNSVIATTKLVRDIEVCAVIGTAFTSGATSMIPIASREGVPLLPTCPATIDFNKWVFFVLIDDTLHGPGMLKFMVEDLKAKKIAVLTAPEVGFLSGIKAIEDNLDKYGAKIIIKEQYEFTDTSVIPQLTKIKAAKPDVILNYSIGTSASVAAKNYKQLGIKVPVVNSWGVASKEHARLAGEVVAGKPWIVFGLKCLFADKLPPDDPYRKNLYEPHKKALMDKFGKEFQTYGANAHDALHVVVEGLKIAGTDDRAALRDAIEKVKYQGLVGDFSVTPTNHYGMPVSAVLPLVIKNGEYYPYYPERFGLK
jgi:branched-chain amino acid transport system substrate-binding protein